MNDTEIKGAAEWLRLSHIGRWAIVLTATRQSVAEHSWRVQVLCYLWAEAAGLTADEAIAVCHYAMVHDLAEVRTGDMPTSLKTPEFKEQMAAFEAIAAPVAWQLHEELSPLALAYFKYCDIAESILYLKVNGLGAHAASVVWLLETQLLTHHKRTGLPDALTVLFHTAYHQT